MKESTCNVEDPGLIPGSGRCPAERTGNHFSILAWRIPRTEELGRLQSMGSQRIGYYRVPNTFTFTLKGWCGSVG